MADFKRKQAPSWPTHLATFNPEHGWHCSCEWRDARIKRARECGFSPLALITAMTAEPSPPVGDRASCVGCAYRYERFPWLEREDRNSNKRRRTPSESR